MMQLAEIYGLPAQEAMSFPSWENAMLTGESAQEVEAGGIKCYEFGLQMLELKKASPSDDLFSRLLEEHRNGVLSVDELVSTYIVLMIGGGEVANAISSTFHQLLATPHWLEEIARDPLVTRLIVEEGLRLESPFRILPPRFADHPVRVGDLAIPAGEMIAVSPAGANRDSSHFSNPDAFQPSERSKGHLAFGDGVHKCLGSLLAKMQMEEALIALANLNRDFHIDASMEEPCWRPGDFMRRLDRLVVTITRRGLEDAERPRHT